MSVLHAARSNSGWPQPRRVVSYVYVRGFAVGVKHVLETASCAVCIPGQIIVALATDLRFVSLSLYSYPARSLVFAWAGFARHRG